MCKIFCMTNATRVDVSPRLLGILRDAVTRTTDRDGFGWVAQHTEGGALAGEKTTTPASWRPLESYSGGRTHTLPVVVRTSTQFGDLPTWTPGSGSRGKKRPSTVGKYSSLLAHGRYSTNTVSLANTHPMLSDTGDVALIHNGVVSDHGHLPPGILKTNNDTEILLRHWEEGGVEAVEESVGGYYAFCVLQPDGRTHVVRDSSAVLYITYSRTVDSYLLATTEEILREVCTRMRWMYDKPELLSPNTYVQFDTSGIHSHRVLQPRPRTYAAYTPAVRAALGVADSEYTRAGVADSEYGDGEEDEKYYAALARKYRTSAVTETVSTGKSVGGGTLLIPGTHAEEVDGDDEPDYREEYWNSYAEKSSEKLRKKLAGGGGDE